MNINIIYNPTTIYCNQLKQAIKIINTSQNEYKLIDYSCNYENYEIFNEVVVDFNLWRTKLSEIKNYNIFIISAPFTDNWFSHEDQHYSLVTTHSWNDKFAPPSLKSYILYEIAQALLTFTADIDEPNFINRFAHIEKSIGCINDMCANKSDIKIGISAGYICPTCRMNYLLYGVPEIKLQSIEMILSAVRSQALGKPLPVPIYNEKKVFIVHGHNEEVLTMVADYITKIGLEPIILKDLALPGIDTILNLISDNSDVMCAILLFTGDDKGCKFSREEFKKRARQNVVFEAGYFIGKLGKEKVLMLYENGVELPSDLGGCRYIDLDLDETWKNRLCANLQMMGLNPSNNKTHL